MRSLVKHSQKNADQASKAKKEHEVSLSNSRDKMLKDRDELLGTQTTSRNDAEHRESRVKALDNTFNDYQRRDIDKAINTVSEADLIYARQKACKGKLDAIDQGQQSILNYFDQQKTLYKDRLVENMTGIDRKIEDARSRADKQIEEIDNDYKEKESQYVESDEKKLAILSSALSELENKQGQAQHAFDHPTIPQSLLQEKDAKTTALINAKSETAKSKDILATHQKNYDNARFDYIQCEQAKTAAEHNLSAVKERRDRKIQQLNPEEGTLLHFLRTEKPDWGFDIGKVINDALLTRHDLEPSIIDESLSCYGLALNLDKLQSLPEADITELSAEIEREEQAVKNAEIKLKQADADLFKANDARIKMDKVLSEYQQTYKSFQSKEKTALAELNEVARQVLQAQESAQTTAKTELDKITKSRNDKKNEHNNVQRQIKDSALSRRQQCEDAIRTKRVNLETYLADCKNKKALFTQSTNEECLRLDKERDAQLKAQGIDIDARNRVDSELKDLDKSIQFIEENKPSVDQYIQWMRDEYSQREKLYAAAQEHRQAEKDASESIKKLEKDWSVLELDLRSKMEALDKKLEKLFSGMADANRHISGLLDYRDYEFESYDAVWTLDVLVALKNQTKADESRLKEQIAIELRALLKKFREQGQTPPAVYVDVQALNYDPQVSRDWLPMFKNWYEHEQMELRRLLLSESITIASSIRSFHSNMKEFNTKVQKFNRELQENLDTNLSFSSISEVCVEIVCTLTELKFWPAISEMAEIQEQWSGMAQDDLPPMNFASSLENLLESWEIKSGIRAELKNLIRIQGHVVENCSRREFRRSSDLKNISSKGLSYLILTIIFVGFINRIRKGSSVNITWAIDELKEIDIGNVQSLVDMLTRNNITLISAFPDPDPLTLELFKHSFSVDHDYGLMSAKFDLGDWGDWGDWYESESDQEEPTNV